MLKQAYLLTMMAALYTPATDADGYVDVWFTLLGAGVFGGSVSDVVLAIKYAKLQYELRGYTRKVRINLNVYKFGGLTPMDKGLLSTLNFKRIREIENPAVFYSTASYTHRSAAVCLRNRGQCVHATSQ